MKVPVKIKKVHTDAIIPKYQSNEAAGFDVHAIVDVKNPFYVDMEMCDYYGNVYKAAGPALVIQPMKQCIVSTGLAFSLPPFHELQIRPRSGLAAKRCITITNSPGTLDSDYHDELKIILFNLGQEPFVIWPNDRIAQCVLAPIIQADFEEVDDFDEEAKKRDRGGGFGSTGV